MTNPQLRTICNLYRNEPMSHEVVLMVVGYIRKIDPEAVIQWSKDRHAVLENRLIEMGCTELAKHTLRESCLTY